MLRKLIIAGAAVAALASPALAAEQWYLVHPEAPTGAGCQVLDHRAQAGEQEIAGPFTTEAGAKAAMAKYGACQAINY